MKYERELNIYMYCQFVLINSLSWFHKCDYLKRLIFTFIFESFYIPEISNPVEYMTNICIIYKCFFFIVALGNIQVSVGSDHQMAQSACMGEAEAGAYASAIPRSCYGGKTCESICVDATSTMNQGSTAGGPLRYFTLFNVLSLI